MLNKILIKTMESRVFRSDLPELVGIIEAVIEAVELKTAEFEVIVDNTEVKSVLECVDIVLLILVRSICVDIGVFVVAIKYKINGL